MAVNDETPWGRTLKRKSQEQEKAFSRRPGVRAQINSGRIWNSLRDAKMNSFVGLILVDNKTTEAPENESYKIDRKKWLELRRDSNRTPPGCHPALQIDLKDVHLFTMELALWDDVVRYVVALESQVIELQDEIRQMKGGKDG